jgi:hypothetical protein
MDYRRVGENKRGHRHILRQNRLSLEDDMSYMPLIEKNDDINLMHETDSPAHFIILSLKISFKIKES